MNKDLMFSSEDDKWRTPSWLCDEVVEFFDGDFLDPAAPEDDPTYAGAVRHFTKEDDGLTKEWKGSVYLNPPYGNEISQWVEKFAQEYEAGRMLQGLILLPARTDTQWWKRMVSLQPLALFFYGRLKFEGADNSAPFPSALMYVGVAKRGEFISRFDGKGWMARVTRT